MECPNLGRHQRGSETATGVTYDSNRRERESPSGRRERESPSCRVRALYVFMYIPESERGGGGGGRDQQGKRGTKVD